MKVYKKHIKDIQNVTAFVKVEDIYTEFTRVSPTEFEKMFKSPSKWVCTGCGEYLDEENEADHRRCILSKVSEEYVTDFISEVVKDDEDNVIEINKGYDDQCYIRLV